MSKEKKSKKPVLDKLSNKESTRVNSRSATAFGAKRRLRILSCRQLNSTFASLSILFSGCSNSGFVSLLDSFLLSPHFHALPIFLFLLFLVRASAFFVFSQISRTAVQTTQNGCSRECSSNEFAEAVFPRIDAKGIQSQML